MFRELLTGYTYTSGNREAVGKNGVDVKLFKKEQQVAMIKDTLDNTPATVVALTGDGMGLNENTGFHSELLES